MYQNSTEQQSNCIFICSISFSEIPLGVVTASLEAATSCAKLHEACSDLVSLVMEGRNILCMRKLRRAQSSAQEVKNERVE